MIVRLCVFRHSVAFLVNENAFKNARVTGTLDSFPKAQFVCHKSCRCLKTQTQMKTQTQTQMKTQSQTQMQMKTENAIAKTRSCTTKLFTTVIDASVL